MKYLILFCIILFALPGFGQSLFTSISTSDGGQDSVVYKKLPNTSESFKGDSIYYKITYQKQGETYITITEPFTDQDTLIGKVLFNNYTDGSRQYKEANLDWEAAEKG